MPDYSAHTDLELIDLLKSSDHFAFTEIYNRYWDKLVAISYNHTREKFAAKEIVQDLFVGIWNRRTHIEIHHLSGYLATAVKFAIFKQIERERRRREIENNKVIPITHTTLEQEIEFKFLQEYLHGEIEKLPEKCRLVFNYSRMQDMSIPEIAKEMNISEKTVEGHLTKGLKAIKNNLKDSGILSMMVGTSLYNLLK
jgi:RNA polymerase sigma-70 factor (family 1)